MELVIDKSIEEFINFLKFTYIFSKKTNTLFYICDKDYFINIIINDNKDLIIKTFDKKHFDELTYDYNYDLYFDINEKLLVKLYKNGVGIKDLFSYLKTGEIKSNNFGIFKFYAFMKNFDFSPNSWKKFIK